MKYKVTDIKKRHIDSINKDVLEVKLDGVVHDKVQIWQDFPLFETITFGSEVEGEIVEKVSGKYTNYTLYAPKVAKQGNGGAFKTKQINDAMEKKEASIGKFQANKEQSILLMSSMRDATLLTVEKIKRSEIALTDEDIKDIWLRWRNWLIKQGEIEETNAF